MPATIRKTNTTQSLQAPPLRLRGWRNRRHARARITQPDRRHNWLPGGITGGHRAPRRAPGPAQPHAPVPARRPAPGTVSAHHCAAPPAPLSTLAAPPARHRRAGQEPPAAPRSATKPGHGRGPQRRGASAQRSPHAAKEGPPQVPHPPAAVPPAERHPQPPRSTRQLRTAQKGREQPRPRPADLGRSPSSGFSWRRPRRSDIDALLLVRRRSARRQLLSRSGRASRPRG